jgi:hypothetical protein
MGEVQGGGYYFTEEQVTVSATANEGYRFVNWTENGTEVSTSANYVFNAGSNRTLMAHFEEEPPVVPPTLIVENTVLNNGDEECYNATQDIIVAGGDQVVEFLPGSTGTFIAGSSIVFLPGFHAHSGSTAWAHITTNNTFCTPVEPNMLYQPDPEKSANTLVAGITSGCIARPSTLKVYPNPSKGRIVVEWENQTGKGTLSLSDVTGRIVYHSALGEFTRKVEISNLVQGMYLVTLREAKKVNTARVIVSE